VSLDLQVQPPSNPGTSTTAGRGAYGGCYLMRRTLARVL